MKCDEKDFKNRIHRTSGQITAVESMYVGKRTAEEILQQLIAVRSSLSSLAKLIVQEEIKGCLPSDDDTSEKSVSKMVETLFKVT